MTIGIYSLYWEEQDLIYIGQSERIEGRFKDHLRMLRTQSVGRYNCKLQDTYNLYGDPYLTIIEECTIKELNDREIFWIKEFNSFSTFNGLNLTGGGAGTGIGISSGHAKYSKTQILKVFSLLYNDLYSVEKIRIRTKVSTSTIKSIASGHRHIWLKEEYPEQFNTMLEKVRFKHRTKSKGQVICPTGEIIEVLNLKNFCLTQEVLNLNIKTSVTGISKLLRGGLLSYKGYKRLAN